MSQTGDVLLHYRLLETLGKGGGGVVWRAFDTQLGREIALKRLPEAVAGDPEALERFEREARAVAALNHPNIVTIHAIERAEGAPFLTMELVRGQTLNRLITGGGLPLERLFELAGPLVDAVAAAHQRGITHRDLKPRNIMVTDAGQVKVLDFGLARVAPAAGPGTDMSSVTTETQSRTGQLLGTLPYMSPEQVQGRTLDARSDIFSIGVILYEMATGRRPFAGGSPADLIASILRDPTPSPAAVRAEVPPGFARIVERCLEKDPRRRLQSCVDLKAGLDDLRREGSEYVRSFGPSVAVLPFADMSQEKDQEYFCEGMAEELIAALTRIEGLRVASRTSSFLFRGTSLDTREIGRRLQVSTLLEGSVRKDADKLRVNAQLSDVATTPGPGPGSQTAAPSCSCTAAAMRLTAAGQRRRVARRSSSTSPSPSPTPPTVSPSPSWSATTRRPPPSKRRCSSTPISTSRATSMRVTASPRGSSRRRWACTSRRARSSPTTSRRPS